ncbi:hypothetical protein QFC22_006530 [Naganishia vaughanmartiniae]|uniref:Uncharacterized protein n=1 Tax=Naganishia vaughanmartiniae TaxID=1424756 RepID=A0ACC2WIB9_9TREE|nr:hypothetical protein QFC22_006530 [Naganishia vaughanmartiniae]
MKNTKGSNKTRKAPIAGAAPPQKKSRTSSSLSAGPNAAAKQPKKLKLRDQKFIPVPQSAFLKTNGKAKVAGDAGEEAVDEEEEEEEEEEDAIDMDDMMGGGESDEEEEEEEQQAKAPVQKQGTQDLSFLVGLDAKTLSRSKKETDRIHALQKSQNPLPKKRKAKEIELESDLDDEDVSDWDSEMDDEDLSGGDGGSDDESLLDDSAGSDDDEEDDDDDEDEDEQVNLRKRKTRGTDQDNLEASYEAAAKRRSVKATTAQAKQDATAEVGHLPIKLPGGEIQQVAGTTKIEVPVDPKLKKQQQQDDEETVYSESEDEGEMQAEEEREVMSRTKGRFGRMGIADILSESFDDGDTTGGSKPKDKERARRRLDLAKEQIARTGAEVMAGGELIDNLPLLTRLSTFSLDKVRLHDEEQSVVPVPASIRALALISQLAVYKDLIPGYRIRELTALEEAEKVREDVRRMREGEKGLIKNYRLYLKTLETEIKRKSPLASVSMRCLCDLLTSATHFNFAENIMGIVVARLSRRSWDEDAEMCLQTIITVFRNDNTATTSSVLLRLLARMIKERHYKVNPNVLSCLLHLRLRTELGLDAKGKTNLKHKSKFRDRDDREQQKVKSDIRKKWMNKNRKKAEQEKKEVEKEMEEAEAEVDIEERSKIQTETLKNLFVLYFSILKQPKRSPMLPAAMEGIAKFAHLVNIEFFRDLLLVLKRIIRGEVEEDEDEELNRPDAVGRGYEVRLRMLGIVTAFELLSGQGEALNLDLNDFVVHLYNLLIPLSLDTNIEDAPRNRQGKAAPAPAVNAAGRPKKVTVQLASTSDLLFRCLQLIFFSRHSHTSNSPPWRAAAFAKRLLECSIHLPTATALKSIDFVKQLIAKEAKLEAFLSTDDRTADGIYRPDIEDPQLVNAFATSFWELSLLEREYWEESVRTAAAKLARGSLV